MARQEQASTRKKSTTNQGSSSPSVNTPETLVDVLSQDVQHLQQVTADQASQIARLKRQLYDQPEPEPEPVSEQLERNARALERFNEATIKREQPDIFLSLRAEREQQARKNLLRYRHYGMHKQRKTSLCPCGKHKGIEFLNKDGEQVDHLCPKHWWIIQTWVAMDDKKIKAFVDSTPLDWYLDKYRLEEK